MPLICLLCMMKAMVENREVLPVEESVDKHMATHHPDIDKAREERDHYAKVLTERMNQAINNRHNN